MERNKYPFICGEDDPDHTADEDYYHRKECTNCIYWKFLESDGDLTEDQGCELPENGEYECMENDLLKWKGEWKC